MIHHPAVEADPGFSQTDDPAIQQDLQGFDRQQGLKQRAQQKQLHPDHGVGDNQQVNQRNAKQQRNSGKHGRPWRIWGTGAELAILTAPYNRHFIMRVSALVLALLATSTLPAADLRTHAERSEYRETGRYAEVENLCKQFESDYPQQVRCFSFGTSPEGRPMWALAANADGVVTPEQAQRADLPVVLFQGGIHAGEIDGKDAGFRVLRELLQEPKKPNLLRSQVMLFVPVFNVDGHERFAAWNRPNQRGPATARNTVASRCPSAQRRMSW
jgi:hypothetical protein